jgi:hypothetical protein
LSYRGAIVETVQRITSTTATRTCAICERSLLLGEHAIRFAPNGSDFVDVCPLCQDQAVEYGWVKEGSPTSPTVTESRRRRKLSLASIFEPRKANPEQPVAPEPILRRLSEPELAMVEAADLFNTSPYRRTIAGIAKSLGEPRVSIVQLSGVKSELVVTVAWEISWYQYRVSLDADQIRLAERGHDPSELEQSFVDWNARMSDDGRLVPNIARL